jgi:hypothetical protein
MQMRSLPARIRIPISLRGIQCQSVANSSIRVNPYNPWPKPYPYNPCRSVANVRSVAIRGHDPKNLRHLRHLRPNPIRGNPSRSVAMTQKICVICGQNPIRGNPSRSVVMTQKICVICVHLRPKPYPWQSVQIRGHDPKNLRHLRSSAAKTLSVAIRPDPWS